MSAWTALWTAALLCAFCSSRALAWPGLWCSWPLTRALGQQPHGRLPRLFGIECIVLKAEALADQPAEVLGSGNDARFAALLTAADKLGIQYIATGHHARVELGSDGVHAVCPAVDAALDESAALAALPQDTLARLLLPLGEFTAADVQEMAQDFKVNGTV